MPLNHTKAMRRAWFLLGIVLLLLTACVPQSQGDTGPSVAVINAPADFRVEGLAEKLETELERNTAPNVYSFVSRSRVAFQETHRDMAGSRSPLQAAFIARAFGAEYAVTIGAPIFEREVDEFTFFGTLKREITTEVQLEARVIDPVTADVLATYTSQRYQGTRVETVPEDEELVKKDEDPDLQTEIQRALQEIAPGVATDLELLCSRQVAAQ
jgi:hypothetical protein